MLTTKTSAKEKSVTSSKPESKKGMVEEVAPQIQLNLLWHGLATHVGNNSAAGGAGDSLPIQRKPSHPISTPYIQRMCAECEEELNADTEMPIQTKLTVGAPDDPYEKEADAVADKVMRMPVGGNQDQLQEDAPSIQNKSLNISPIQRLCAECTDELDEGGTPSVQSKSDGKPAQPAVPSSVNNTIDSPGSGSPLNESIRSRVEPVLGADLSNVRVHEGMAAQDASHSLNAKAFTHQSNIFLGRGQSQSNLQLMAHEATHVIQQSGKTSLSRIATKPTDASSSTDIQQLAPENYLQRAEYWVQDYIANLSLSVPFKDDSAEFHFYLDTELHPYFDSNPMLAQNIEDHLEIIFNPEEDLHETADFMGSPAVSQQVFHGMRQLVHYGAYNFDDLSEFLNRRTQLYYEQELLVNVGEMLANEYEIDPEEIDWNAIIPAVIAIEEEENEDVAETAFAASVKYRFTMFLDMLDNEAAGLDEVVGAVAIPVEGAHEFLKNYSLFHGSEIFTDDVFNYQSEAFLSEYIDIFEAIVYMPEDFDLESFRPVEDTSEIDIRREEIVSEFIETEAESRAVLYILDRWTLSAQTPEDFLAELDVEDLRDDLTAAWADSLIDQAIHDETIMEALRSRAIDEARFTMVAWISSYALQQEADNQQLWETFATVPIGELSEKDYAIASDPYAYNDISQQIAQIIRDLLVALSPNAPIENDIIQASIEILARLDIPTQYAGLFLLPELLSYLGSLQRALDEQEQETKRELEERLDLDFEDIAEVVRNYIEHAETFVHEQWIPLLKQIAEERAAENLEELRYLDANWEAVQSLRNIEFARGAMELMYLADELESGRAEEVEYGGRRVGPDGVEHLRNAARLLRASGIENRDEEAQAEKREKVRGVIEDYAQIIEDIRDGTYDPLDYSAAVYQEARQRLGIERLYPATVGMVLSRTATANQNPFIEYAVVRWKFKEGLERSFERGMVLVGLGILTLASALIPGALGIVVAVIDAGLGIYMGVQGVLDAQSVLRMARLDINGDIVGVSEADAEKALTHAWIGLGVTVVLTVGIGALQARMYLRRPDGVRQPRVSNTLRTSGRESSLLRETRDLHGSRLSQSQITGEAEVVARGRSQASTMDGFQEEVLLPNNHIWRRNGATWCRFSIRPFCMPSSTLPRGLRRRSYSDVAATLDDAVDGFGRPLPRDITRRHSYADHGAHTTPAQQEARLRTGVTPGGRTPAAPDAAGRFNTHRAHLDAYQRALDDLAANYMNARGTRAKLIHEDTIDMGYGIGTSYSLAPGPIATAAVRAQTVQRVRFVFRYDGHGWYDLVTMYPVP